MMRYPSGPFLPSIGRTNGTMATPPWCRPPLVLGLGLGQWQLPLLLLAAGGVDLVLVCCFTWGDKEKLGMGSCCASSVEI